MANLEDTIKIQANLQSIKAKVSSLIGNIPDLKSLQNNIAKINVTLKNMNRSSLLTFNRLLEKATKTSSELAKNFSKIDSKKIDPSWLKSDSFLKLEQARALKERRLINETIPFDLKSMAQTSYLNKRISDSDISASKAKFAPQGERLKYELLRLRQLKEEFNVTDMQDKARERAEKAMLDIKNKRKLSLQKTFNLENSKRLAEQSSAKYILDMENKKLSIINKQLTFSKKRASIEKQTSNHILSQLKNYAIRYASYFALRQLVTSSVATRMSFERGSMVFANILPEYGYGTFGKESAEQRKNISEKMMRDYIKMANKYKVNPYSNLLDVAQFVGTKVAGITLEEQIKRVETLTKVAAQYSMGTVQKQMLFKNFRDFGAKGKISSRDLNELAGTGLNLRQMMADLYGISIQEFTKKLESGQIESVRTLNMLFDSFDKRLKDFKMPENFVTSLENIKATISDIMLTITSGTTGYIIRGILSTLNTLLKIIQPLIPMFTTMLAIWTTLWSINKINLIKQTGLALITEQMAVRGLARSYMSLGLSKKQALKQGYADYGTGYFNPFVKTGYTAAGLGVASGLANVFGFTNVGKGLEMAGITTGVYTAIGTGLSALSKVSKLGKLASLAGVVATAMSGPIGLSILALGAVGAGGYAYLNSRNNNVEKQKQDIKLTIENKTGLNAFVQSDQNATYIEGVNINMLGAQF